MGKNYQTKQKENSFQKRWEKIIKPNKKKIHSNNKKGGKKYEKQSDQT
jgi:hypothetical protein